MNQLPVIPLVLHKRCALLSDTEFIVVLSPFFLILCYQQKTGPATTSLFKHLLKTTSYSNPASISLKIQLLSKFQAVALYFVFFSSNNREQRAARSSEKESKKIVCSFHKDCTLNLHELLRPKPWTTECLSHWEWKSLRYHSGNRS